MALYQKMHVIWSTIYVESFIALWKVHNVMLSILGATLLYYVTFFCNPGVFWCGGMDDINLVGGMVSSMISWQNTA